MGGIKDLGRRVSAALPIDDVLDELDAERHGHLERALLARCNGDYVIRRDEIVRACAEDGYVVTDWSIRMWRRRHG